jgi:hypothetical protein
MDGASSKRGSKSNDGSINGRGYTDSNYRKTFNSEFIKTNINIDPLKINKYPINGVKRGAKKLFAKDLVYN